MRHLTRTFAQWMSGLILVALATCVHAGSYYSQDFNTGTTASGWSTVSSPSGSATWSVTNQNYAVDASNAAMSVAYYGQDSWATDFSYSVRLYSNYYASANNTSVIFGYADSTHFYELQFDVKASSESAGSVKLIQHDGSLTSGTTLSTQSVDDIVPDAWFDVKVTLSGTAPTLSVQVNGATVLSGVALPGTSPGNPSATTRRIGVGARWNLAQFDEVVVQPAYSENFNSGTLQNWSTGNNPWGVVSGMLRNTEPSSSALPLTTAIYTGSKWQTDFTYALDVYSDWYSSANNLDAIFGYKDPGNYYEVQYNVQGPGETSGSVTVTRFVSSSPQPIASASVTGMTADTLFNTRITLSGTRLTVSVNGFVAIDVALASTQLGNIGVGSRYNMGRFDNISVLPAGGGVLQFASGFEPNVTTTTVNRTDHYDGTINGVDAAAPAAKNNWDQLPTYLQWLSATHVYLQGGGIDVVDDPLGSTNKVLRLQNLKSNQVAGVANLRSQVELNQSIYVIEKPDPEPGVANKFNQQFMRYRMFIPAALKTAYANNSNSPSWYMMWESHIWPEQLLRHGIYLVKQPGSSEWAFQVIQEQWKLGDAAHPQDPCLTDTERKTKCTFTLVQRTYENRNQQNINVPFGQWFTLDVYFKYDDTDGRFYVALTPSGQPRVVLGDFVGKTKLGNKLHDLMPFKLYHSDKYFTQSTLTELDHYYDDFEIWSDFPPGYDP